MERFISIDMQSRDGYPCQWWNSNNHIFSSLSKLDNKNLSAPPPSVETERLYRFGENIYTPPSFNADTGTVSMWKPSQC